MRDGQPKFSLTGPLGEAQCYEDWNKRLQLYFEPYGQEGLQEYIKPIFVGAFDDEGRAMDAAKQVTGVDELDAKLE